jgi:TIR domain-containing protein
MTRGPRSKDIAARPAKARKSASTASSNPTIFISHCVKDGALAKRIDRLLSETGYPTYFAPKHLKSGSAWARQLADALEKNVILLALVTADYFKRDWTQAEFATAFGADPLGRKGMHLIVLVDGARLPRRAYKVLQHVELSSAHVDRDFEKIRQGIEQCRVNRRRRRGDRPAMDGGNALRADAGSAAAAALPIPSTDAIADAYETHLYKEMRDIRDRISNPGKSPGSRTRRLVFGWQAILGLDKTTPLKPMPSILLYLMRQKHRELEDQAKHKLAKAVHDIVSLRYYLFCLVALQQSKAVSVKPIIDAFLAGTRGPGAAVPDRYGFVDHCDAIDRILKAVKAPSCNIGGKDAAAFARELALAAGSLGLSIHDLWDDENGETRNAGRHSVPSKGDIENTPNYRIEIYFADRHRSYFDLMTRLSARELTLVRTVSETLVPNALARVTLWVRSRGDLKGVIQELVEYEEHNVLVFDHRTEHL